MHHGFYKHVGEEKEGEDEEKEGKEQVEWGERQMHNCVWWPKIGHTHQHTQLRDGVARWRRVCVLFVATVCHGAASVSAAAFAIVYCSFLSLFFVVVASFLCLSLSPVFMLDL